MTIKSSWQIDLTPPWETENEAIWHKAIIELIERGVLFPDTRLKDIADAWKKYKQIGYSTLGAGNAANRLETLLDALTDAVRRNEDRPKDE